MKGYSSQNNRVEWLFKLCQKLGTNGTIPAMEAMAFMLELDKHRGEFREGMLTKEGMESCNTVLKYIRSKCSRAVIYRATPNVFKEEFKIET